MNLLFAGEWGPFLHVRLVTGALWRSRCWSSWSRLEQILY
ncbi:hypothetical protein J2X61_005553 [Bacillus sp. 3255]|nr:hypothetical protein [Bacillus sp. 3255]